MIRALASVTSSVHAYYSLCPPINGGKPAEPIFGKDIADKFPNHVGDMLEAGNCFMLGRNTACVFHLMRVMEAAVQGFGTKLGVPLVYDLERQTILDRLNPPIKPMNSGDPSVQCILRSTQPIPCEDSMAE